MSMLEIPHKKLADEINPIPKNMPSWLKEKVTQRESYAPSHLSNTDKFPSHQECKIVGNLKEKSCKRRTSTVPTRFCKIATIPARI